MIKNRYKKRTKRFKNNFKSKNFFKKQLNKVFIALIILLIVLVIKKINMSFTNKVIRIIDRGIRHEFDIKAEGRKVLDFSKKVFKLPEKAVSVFSFDNKNESYISPLEGGVQKTSRNTKGVDIISDKSKEVLSIGKGTVTRVEDREKSGYYVTIDYKDFEAIYGQLDKINISMGDVVFKGEKIGTLGELNGKSTPLYFEIWKDGNNINPKDIIKLN
ncbi:M23 family metallopeptidase [Anaerosalibacter bizertensis]|uniref:M23 family metallopeptidase n=1 Tax=Anaerosalibacter bizertensis TaxID=932217 RepID=UPI001C0EDF01|nr:M23 family metallopeptidase [Anaerosalibacter bizertensis]MBU5294057.1 M23 family metallopeptidase [Anaerosalibacter bizertensis]